ncbi:transcription initiation factor TFIID subunit 9 [Aethina tumida]|uniref:transcription initiation factor TFIID subunit 9 n=1 Tax=Aethina tumida TaxID=116153 RepID=UPI00096B46BE|nr:transcription initiation factor TFIID subunit 9 [Aethina tumida]
MAEKEKSKAPQSKNIPKDGQVIMSIMKEMGITEYEPKTIVQLTEFVYKYATSILEEARIYANHTKKKLEVDDVRLALQLTSESTFTTPPPREVILECAHVKNYTPLPSIKPHCGLRLPPDRYCLSSCNYTLKNVQKKKPLGIPTTMKLTAKPNINYIKRAGVINVNKQTVTIPKVVPKITTTIQQQPKTVLKHKIQIQQNIGLTSANGGQLMEVDNNLKRKRDDDMELMQ